MQEKEVISGRQLILLVFTFTISTGTLFIPTLVAQKAGQDGWLSVLIGALVSVVVVWVVTTLGLRYPQKTLIEYSQDIVGKFLGKLTGVVYILFFLQLSSITVREISSTIQATLLQNTHLWVITLIVFLSSAYSVKMGLETITRANVINLIVIYLAIFAVFFLVMKDMNPQMLTPVLASGMVPVLKGSVSPAWLFGEAVSIAFIMPFVNKPRETRLCAIIGVVWAGVTLSFISALTVMVFGPQLCSILSYPTLEAVRYINVGQYIQRVEIFFLIPWMVSNYIKICFFYYVTVFIISKWFAMEKTKTLVIPVGLLIFSMSLALFRNSVELTLFFGDVWGFYSLPVEVGIPALLLTIELIRKKGNGKSVPSQ